MRMNWFSSLHRLRTTPGITNYIVTLVFIVGCLPFFLNIIGYNRGEEFPEPLEPACQNKCVTIRFPRSSVDKFDSFSLDSTQVLFVHFSGHNIYPKPSDTEDILDSLNLVWVESNEAPFLSLDLGFRVYSFTTLSRVVHHMDFKVEVEPVICLQNMSHSCVTANLARVFLGNVTKARGVLCYAVNDSDTINYRCCKGNPKTQRVECDIPAVLSPEMATIFKTMAVATLIGFLCFPALLNIFPDKKNSDTLSANSQVHDPLFHLVISTVQAIRHHSKTNYGVNLFRKLLIGFALPVLYYIDLGLQWHTITYDMPKMFNDRVRELWVSSNTAGYLEALANMAHLGLLKMQFILLVVYWASVTVFCFTKPTANLRFSSKKHRIKQAQHLIKEEKNMKVNWRTPCHWTKGCWLQVKSLFGIARDCKRPWCLRLVAFLGSFWLMLLTLVATLVLLILYAWFISPLKKTMCIFCYRVYLYFLEKGRNYLYCLLVFVYLTSFFLYVAILQMLMSSLFLSTKLVVYLWMGLVVSRDYYFPRVAAFSVLAYYCWNCLSSVKSKYQVLLKQTFAKCKEYQEKQPNGRKAVTFDDKGVPSISSELFKQVINEILPKSEVYTRMILKLTTIILFLLLTFSSILVYGSSNFNQSTQALAVFLTGLLPKLFEVFEEGSSDLELCQMENACRVEKIVNDFLNSNTGTTTGRDEEQQRTSTFNDQIPPTSAKYAMELDQLNPDERETPGLHSGDSDGDDASIKSSEGEDREDLEVVLVHSFVNSERQSDDANSEEQPLSNPSGDQLPTANIIERHQPAAGESPMPKRSPTS